MGLSLLLSTNHIVIHSYSPVADFLLVVMCLLALLLIRQTFIKQSRTFRIFKLLFCPAFHCRSFQYLPFIMPTFFPDRTPYSGPPGRLHYSLLSLFCLYIAYLKILIVFPKNIGRKYTFLSFAILVVTGVADLASPLTGWGFHQDHYGIWYENILSTPFMVGYLLYLAVILFLLVRYRRRLPTALFHMLIFTETVCGLIVVMEAAMNTTSFLATTYFLPLLVVLYMLHANAYDPKTWCPGFRILG